jgi:phosphonate transport system substrate-binding protein
MLAGLLLVRKDGPIQKVEDLANQKIAFPAPNAFGASLWMRANLTNIYHLPYEAVYVGTHQNTFRQVVMGDVAAGGGVTATLQKESPEIRDNLRLLYTTPNAAPHPVMVHPRIDAAIRDKVQAAFLAMAKNEEDQKLLAAVQLPKPMIADYDKEYLPLKALNVQSFVQ